MTSTSLINVYINDLPGIIEGKARDVKCALYADDLVLWTSAPTNHTVKRSVLDQSGFESLV